MYEACRICLKSDELISLFDEVDSIQLSVKLMSFTSVKISQNDNLPSVICLNCAGRVNNSYEFKVLCEDADSKLRARLISESVAECTVNVKDEVSCCDEPEPEDILYEPDNNESDYDQETEKEKSKRHRSLSKSLKRKKKSKKKRKGNDENILDLSDIKLEAELNGNPDESEIQKPKKAAKPQKEQCFTCGKVMSSRFRLKMHMRTHTGERPYACCYCPKKFALSQNLKVHERVHTGIKPLVCTTCGRAFAQSAGLVAHMRLHTGETPYKCNLCPQAFRTPGHLQYHISRQHTGEKRHVCGVCERPFITRGDLTQHTRTHSGERPHVCSVCGLRLARASHLARHMLTHTGVKPHACQLCSATFAQRTDLNQHIKRHSQNPTLGQTTVKIDKSAIEK